MVASPGRAVVGTRLEVQRRACKEASSLQPGTTQSRTSPTSRGVQGLHFMQAARAPPRDRLPGRGRP